MNTTAAAQQAGVNVATIRAWCRVGAVAAVKKAGRWVIDAASLAYRISLGRSRKADLTRQFIDVIGDSAEKAADAYNVPALRALLAQVKARDVTAIMGAGVSPRQIRLTDQGWTGAARLVSFQLGCVQAEH